MPIWKTFPAALAFAFLIGLTGPGHAGAKETCEARLKVAQEKAAKSQLEFSKLNSVLTIIRYAEGAQSNGKFAGCNKQLNKAFKLLG